MPQLEPQLSQPYQVIRESSSTLMAKVAKGYLNLRDRSKAKHYKGTREH